MSLEIVYEPPGYRVSVSPPHAAAWQSPRPLTPTEVLEELSKRGCHSTDITDALYSANPAWTVEHDGEVRRRREAELHAMLNEPPEDGTKQRGG